MCLNLFGIRAGKPCHRSREGGCEEVPEKLRSTGGIPNVPQPVHPKIFKVVPVLLLRTNLSRWMNEHLDTIVSARRSTRMPIRRVEDGAVIAMEPRLKQELGEGVL